MNVLSELLNDVSEGYSLFCCNCHRSLFMIEKSVASKFVMHVKSLKILKISRKYKNPASFETGFIVSTVVDDVSKVHQIDTIERFIGEVFTFKDVANLFGQTAFFIPSCMIA